jgi:hypothetical protein
MKQQQSLAANRPKPTIWNALAARVGREPTHREACDEVRRILSEGTRDLAEAGKLAHQRKR